VTTPGVRPASTSAWTAAFKRSRRSEDIPTDSGLAVGNSAAFATAQAEHKTITARRFVDMEHGISIP
jgi:hypothetical protein